MGLLDELKKQAAAAVRNKPAAESTADAAQKRILRVKTVNARMQDALQFFKETAKQLDYLQLESPRVFDIETAGRMDGLKLKDFRVDSTSKQIDGHAYLECVLIKFIHCNEGKAICVKRMDLPLVGRLRDFLNHGGIRFTLNEVRNDKGFVVGGAFEIPFRFNSEVALVSDFDAGEILVRIKNIDRIICYEKRVAAETVQNDFLDSIARHVLGRPSDFRNVAPSMTLSRPVPAGELALSRIGF